MDCIVPDASSCLHFKSDQPRTTPIPIQEERIMYSPMDHCSHCMGRSFCSCFNCVVTMSSIEGKTPCAVCGGSGQRDDEVKNGDFWRRFWVGLERPFWPYLDGERADRALARLNREYSGATNHRVYSLFVEDFRRIPRSADACPNQRCNRTLHCPNSLMTPRLARR